MADLQLILELMFLHIRGGCSLTVLLFFLMLVGTCCFILSASLCVVRPTFLCIISFSIVRGASSLSVNVHAQKIETQKFFLRRFRYLNEVI